MSEPGWFSWIVARMNNRRHPPTRESSSYGKLCESVKSAETVDSSLQQKKVGLAGPEADKISR